MRTITLPCGSIVKVCDKGYKRVRGHAWSKCGDYVSRSFEKSRKPCGKRARGTVYMHRQIIDAKKGEHVDHINGNTLDNRLSNLRICAPTQNLQNKKSKIGTSKYKGVYFNKSAKKWRAYITVNKKRRHLGTFENESDAALTYNKHAKEFFGEFALLNEVAR